MPVKENKIGAIALSKLSDAGLAQQSRMKSRGARMLASADARNGLSMCPGKHITEVLSKWLAKL